MRRASASFGAIGVGGYIALAGLWGSPICTFTEYWVSVVGPIVGAAIVVGFAAVRG